MIPEVRTGRRGAIALAVLGLAVLAITVLAGRQLEDVLDSETAGTAVLAVWCVLAAGVAIAAVVDAYVRPDGELISLWVAIAGTVLAILSALVIAGIVAGATQESVRQAEQDLATRSDGAQPAAVQSD